MSHTPEQAAFLERFNQPELFLADAKNLDLRQEAVFTRPDGVEVRIMTTDFLGEKKGMFYLEDLTYPASPFGYRNIYDENGIILYKAISFYGGYIFSSYECKDGKCVISSSPSDKIKIPPISIAQTRAALLKETKIDLYDTSIINRVGYRHATDKINYMYILRARKFETVIDAETGKVLYEREILWGDEGNSSIPGAAEVRESAAYLKSVNMVKKHMDKEQGVYKVYKKDGIQDPRRFYEIFLQKPRAPRGIPLVSYLLDHKTEKILYRCEMYLHRWPIGGLPYVELWDEYQQHLKMREAEEEKPGPGPLSWFQK